MEGDRRIQFIIEHILPIYAGMDYDNIDEDINKDVLDSRVDEILENMKGVRQ